MLSNAKQMLWYALNLKSTYVTFKNFIFMLKIGRNVKAKVNAANKSKKALFNIFVFLEALNSLFFDFAVLGGSTSNDAPQTEHAL